VHGLGEVLGPWVEPVDVRVDPDVSEGELVERHRKPP
jgi:hypothetical protein